MKKRPALFIVLLIITCLMLTTAVFAAPDENTANADILQADSGSVIFNIGIRVFFASVIAIAIFIVYRSDRKQYYAYHKYLGVPAPKYRFRYIWCGLPYKDWEDPSKPKKKKNKK